MHTDSLILDIPKLKVDYNGNRSTYKLFHSSRKNPYYCGVLHQRKDLEDDISVAGIYLPITKEDFYNNKEDFFYGTICILERMDTHFIESLTDSDQTFNAIDIYCDVRRIRYYPDEHEDDGIHIDMLYDSLTHTRLMSFHGSGSSSMAEEDIIARCVHGTLSQYCDFYHDRII